MGEVLYRQFLQYFRNPMYFSIYILQVAFHPIALGGHHVLWRSALQERVDVVERSVNAAAHKLEPLNRNRAAPKHEIMARLQKACNHVRYFVRGVAPTPLGEHLKSCPSVSFDIFADARNSFVHLRSGNSAGLARCTSKPSPMRRSSFALGIGWLFGRMHRPL